MAHRSAWRTTFRSSRVGFYATAPVRPQVRAPRAEHKRRATTRAVMVRWRNTAARAPSCGRAGLSGAAARFTAGRQLDVLCCSSTISASGEVRVEAEFRRHQSRVLVVTLETGGNHRTEAITTSDRDADRVRPTSQLTTDWRSP